MSIPVVQALTDWREGKKTSLDDVMPLVYAELRRLAESHMRNERPGHTLQPTALVNEVYLRLIGQHSVNWQDRAQLTGMAAQMMRRVLADHAKRRGAFKRGSAQPVLSFDDVPEPVAPPVAFDQLDEALNRLAAMDERQARVVELKLFGGLQNNEVAEVLGVSLSTVERAWSSARLWLVRELTPGNNPVGKS